MIWHPDMPTEYRNQIVTGDARKLVRRIPDESVDAVITDPPYGIGFNYGNTVADDPKRYRALIRWLARETDRILRPGGIALVFQAMPRLRETWRWFPADSRIFSANKNFVPMSFCAIPYATDPAVFWIKPGAKPVLPNRTQRDYFVADTANHRARIKWHRCPKPIDLMRYLCDGFCPVGGTVVDFFAGSGTTAVACRQVGRNYVAFELDPETATLARERVRLTPEPLFVLDAPEPQGALALEAPPQ